MEQRKLSVWRGLENGTELLDDPLLSVFWESIATLVGTYKRLLMLRQALPTHHGPSVARASQPPTSEHQKLAVNEEVQCSESLPKSEVCPLPFAYTDGAHTSEACAHSFNSRRLNQRQGIARKGRASGPQGRSFCH